VDGQHIKFTCVSMGNPHAVAYTMNGKPVKVSGRKVTSRASVQPVLNIMHARHCQCTHPASSVMTSIPCMASYSRTQHMANWMMFKLQ
jgi:diaminopimelate epimerase